MEITKSQEDRYYKALLDRDPTYLGSFIVGVKSTSIFCISTCRARKPLRKNVTFFEGAREAMAAGFRPCKVCRPTESGAPEMVELVMDELRSRPMERIRDADLRAMGIAPERLRRWFNTHHGMTFQAYQRMFRVNLAYQEIQGGETATGAALDSGYNSLSGFGYAYKQVVGKSPTFKSNLLTMTRFDTPIGPMFAMASDRGLCLLEFTDRKMLETELADLQKRLGARIASGENEFTRMVQVQLTEYFNKERETFDIPLDAPGSEFQHVVWDELQRIPFGTTTSYKAMANRLGQPTAMRAIARANGSNRIAIVIPCHRVIGADGQLRGYGGGIARKDWLLRHEGAIF